MGIIPKWQTAHNTYVQIAVETGIAGFITYMCIIFVCYSNFKKIRLGGAKEGEIKDMSVMAGLFQIGFFSLLLDAFFLSQGYSMLITIYFATSASMRNIVFNTST